MILLTTGLLVLASLLSSKIADRIGVPVLLVFLGIGMLAGSDGPGGIHFDNPAAANLVGTIALAFILFSGGLDTNWRIIRPVFVRGTILSTAGVVVTAALVGVFAWAALGFSIYTGLLLGAIVSSTDAAAVFSVLRGRGVGLKGNLKPLLELESGSNDPMAVFLTLGMTQLITVPEFSWPVLIPAFFWNMGSGLALGLGMGKLAGLLFNRVSFEYEGLYPVLSTSLVVLTFGATEYAGGNGFLAVYVCGIVLNGTDFAHKRYVNKNHDALAWLMQILMFLVLGLLVFPSRLPGVALDGLMVGLFLMFVARPAAVFLGLWRSPFSVQERTLVAWTGLRGAVPIVLATYPLMAGYVNSELVFNVVFFTVMMSVLMQGTMLMPVARWLRVDEPLATRPRFSLAIERSGVAQGETREVEVSPNMGAVGKTLADLGIPPDVLILLIGRGDGYIVPRGQTRIEPYDTLLMLGSPAMLQNAVQILETPQLRVRDVAVPDDPLASLPQTTAAEYLSSQVVVIGYGRVGRHVCAGLARSGVPFIVVDKSRAIVEGLRADGIPAVYGDAADPIVLAQAHVLRAAALVIATPDTMKVRLIVEQARQMNPPIHVAVRTHSEMEAELLRKESTGAIFLGEEALADTMVRHVVRRLRPDSKPAPE